MRVWARRVSDEMLSAVAMDGKTLCGTLSAHQRAVHLLALYDQRTGGVLSQLAVDPKTNEPKAALELLKTVVLKGRIVTADAIFCQREVCQQIVEGGGHYFVVVKDNQPELKASIAAEFTAAFSVRRTNECGKLRMTSRKRAARKKAGSCGGDYKLAHAWPSLSNGRRPPRCAD